MRRLVLFSGLLPVLLGLPPVTAKAADLYSSDDCTIALTQSSGMGSDADGQASLLVTEIAARIDAANTSIAIAGHELNHPAIVDAILRAAARGVAVRLFTDAKDILQRSLDDPDDDVATRAVAQRIILEKLRRGIDGIINTADDIQIQAESPVEAVPDQLIARRRAGLPPSAADLPRYSYRVSDTVITDVPLLASGTVLKPVEQGTLPRYHAPATSRMHHKFMVIDGETLLTGSYNFTISGAEGTVFDRYAGSELGHRQQVLTIRNRVVAEGYLRHFDMLWGGPSGPASQLAWLQEPKPGTLDFSTDACGFSISVLFLPNHGALAAVSDEIGAATSSIQFELFSFESKKLIADIYSQAINKHVEIKGVIDERFISAFAQIVGKLDGAAIDFFLADNGQGARVEKSRLFKLLHSKTMIIDGATGSHPAVLTGSANFSETAFGSNRENILILHSRDIALAFTKELRKFAADSYRNRDSYCPSIIGNITPESSQKSIQQLVEQD